MWQTDRQRVEASLPTRMLFTLSASRCFSCFGPDGEVADEEGAETVRRLREILKGACLDPIRDLPERAGWKIAKRIERVHEEVTKEWDDQPAVKLTLTTLYFVQALIESGTLTLYAGSPVSDAIDLLLPMAEHGLEEPALARSARKQARRLLAKCQSAGLYPGASFPESVDG